MTRSNSYSPYAELLRRQLREALYRARANANLTQRAVSESLDWSLSKVVRIEQGVVPVAPSDVRVLLQLYGVTDYERVDQLVALSRSIRDAPDWASDADILTASSREYYANEAHAADVCIHEPNVIPPQFQTDAYAAGLYAELARNSEDAFRLARVQALRRENWLREDGPNVSAILGETALLRCIGGTDAMIEQINFLNHLNTIDRFDIRVVPLSIGPYRGMGTPFAVLNFDEDDLSNLAYLGHDDVPCANGEAAIVVEMWNALLEKLDYQEAHSVTQLDAYTERLTDGHANK